MRQGFFGRLPGRVPLGSHAEHTELGLRDGRVAACGEREAEHVSRFGGIDHAIVPQPRRRVVGMTLLVVPREEEDEQERGRSKS